MSGEVEVAYSAGRRNGTSAPYQRAIVGDLLRVRRDDDALEAAALARRLDRVREQRMAGERADVLPGNALRAGPSRDERDGARGAHRRPAATASSASVGHGHVEPLGGAEDAAQDRVELGAPAGGDVAGGGRRGLVGHLVDDRPLGGGAERDAVGLRDRARLDDRRARAADATPGRCAARRPCGRTPRSPRRAERSARACARGRASRSARRARRCARAEACRPPARPPSARASRTRS